MHTYWKLQFLCCIWDFKSETSARGHQTEAGTHGRCYFHTQYTSLGEGVCREHMTVCTSCVHQLIPTKPGWWSRGAQRKAPVPASPPHHKVADALCCPQVKEQTGPRRRRHSTCSANSSLPAQPMPVCTGLSRCPRSGRQRLALPQHCVP